MNKQQTVEHNIYDFQVIRAGSVIVPTVEPLAITMLQTQPFLLDVSGHAEIPHDAERAHVNVRIASRGSDKASVSSDVLTSVHELEELLRPLSANESDPDEIQATAAVAHWSKTSLSATSERIWDHNSNEKTEKQVYNASMSFDIRFQDFKALGTFGAKISALPHVELQNIEWKLTSATQERFYSELRKKAAQDALKQAREYAEVFGYTDVRPLELTTGFGGSGSLGFGRAVEYAQRPYAAAAASNMPATQPELEFTPQEIVMKWDVIIKFQAS